MRSLGLLDRGAVEDDFCAIVNAMLMLVMASSMEFAHWSWDWIGRPVPGSALAAFCRSIGSA